MDGLSVPAVLAALKFAAQKHRDQRRKGREASPYINHPIEVAELIASRGGVTDADVLRAAVLHDTIEDTKTTVDELESHFGERVRRLVEEVTDDRRLPRQERKRLQVEHAPHLSIGAKLIKMADKISNLRDMTISPPVDWSRDRRAEYLDWTEMVVAGCRGVNEGLERTYDDALAEARRRMAEETGDGVHPTSGGHERLH